jgi:hypothetical protein
VNPGHSPPSSLLLAPWVFWQNRIFAVFSGIFPESWISAQKRDTRAILLKIALVRVSCIQNTQIRGETIAKVFGKVDTFWTYRKDTRSSTCGSSSISAHNKAKSRRPKGTHAPGNTIRIEDGRQQIVSKRRRSIPQQRIT